MSDTSDEFMFILEKRKLVVLIECSDYKKFMLMGYNVGKGKESGNICYLQQK